MTCSPKPSSGFTVLGIDPGLDRTGWAVLRRGDAGEPSLVSCGLLHTPAGRPLGERLESLFRGISAVLSEFSPECAAIEEMFFVKRASSVSATIQARGVILLAAQLQKVPVFPYDPRKVKVTVAGNGGATKAQVQRMIQLIMRIPRPLAPDDVADAAAIGLCHLKLGPIAERLRQAREAAAAR